MNARPEPSALDKPLVLASSSPYRRELLGRLGLPFETSSPQADEARHEGETPIAMVQRLAEAKARAVTGRHPDALIIGSDQVATIDDRILGKPGNFERAVAQLEQSAGRTVTFLTGLSLLDARSGQLQTDVVPYYVTFRKLPRERLERYVDQEGPYDCAGAIRSEGYGVTLFEKLEGDDPTALMGLPLIRLVRMLEDVGVTLP